MRRSIATIDKPEFINVTPCNPLISQCEIKVMYVGENRNKSFISKEVATEMANTLPGCPIVGYFREDKGDFADHGEKVIIDDTGVHFECMTRPYGFVAPDAKVWFQKFEDTDEFGNTTVREYLMTTGFLWTGQFPECESAVSAGKPHSMELDKDTVDGKWAKNSKSGVDFFIINDAIFSKLCILGDDVEPCFEGSSVSAPDISTSFTKDDEEFRQTLFSMMQELKFALKGEHNDMENINEKIDLETSYAKSEEEEKEEKKFDLDETQVEEPVAEVVEEPAAEVVVEEPVVEDSFAKKEEEEKEEEPAEEKESESEEEDEEKKKNFAKEEDKDDETAKEENKEDEEKEKYSLLEQELTSLKEKYSLLEAENAELLAFKNQIEDEQKDTLINSFYMLSDEDKKEVIQNKSKYSLDDIEAKLSVICVRKKVNFDLDDTDKFEDNKEESPITTFNLDSDVTSTPAWVSAVQNTKNSRNI